MNDEQQFLAELMSNPEDVPLRLVYADWLEERGDGRSEYLRADVELLSVMRLPTLTESSKRQLKEIRAKLTKLGKTLDSNWVELVVSARPEVIRCCVCDRLLKENEAISISPRTFRELKTKRYCKLCYEYAARAQMRREAERDYNW